MRSHVRAWCLAATPIRHTGPRSGGHGRPSPDDPGAGELTRHAPRARRASLEDETRAHPEPPAWVGVSVLSTQRHKYTHVI